MRVPPLMSNWFRGFVSNATDEENPDLKWYIVANGIENFIVPDTAYERPFVNTYRNSIEFSFDNVGVPFLLMNVNQSTHL